MSDANLTGADMSNADLNHANLRGANLRGANLSDADLSSARNLTQTQLDEACGNASTKLLEGLTVKSCSTDRWMDAPSDFRRRKDHDAYKRSFERVVRSDD